MKTSDWPQASELSSHEAWRERLREYILKEDRDVEPVFEGREHLFEHVENKVLRAAKGNCNSLTTIVSGAPGAGKSAFAKECMRRYRHGIQNGLPAVPLSMEVARMSPREFVRLLAEALNTSLTPQTSTTHETSSGASIAIARGEYRRATERLMPALLEQADQDGPVPWNVIHEEFDEALAGRPILLLVDEMQRFRQTGNLHHDDIPISLHEGRKAVPIIPVYCGLGDTRDVLAEEAGISRSVEINTFSLAGMEPEETRECAVTILRDHLGLTGKKGEMSRLYDWTVRMSDHWPQHLRSQNAAVAEAMLEADSRDMGDLDLAGMTRRVEQRRDVFYEERAARVAGGEHPMSMLAVVEHATANDGPSKVDLIQVARKALAQEPECNTEPRAFVDAMVHGGLLQTRYGRRGYTAPIPSMRRWLRDGRYIATPLNAH